MAKIADRTEKPWKLILCSWWRNEIVQCIWRFGRFAFVLLKPHIKHNQPSIGGQDGKTLLGAGIYTKSQNFGMFGHSDGFTDWFLLVMYLGDRIENVRHVVSRIAHWGRWNRPVDIVKRLSFPFSESSASPRKMIEFEQWFGSAALSQGFWRQISFVWRLILLTQKASIW